MSAQRVVDGARAAAEELLAVLGHLVSARSRLAGLLLLSALATAPWSLALGLLAVLVAGRAARALGLDSRQIKEGPYGYNALLVGVGLARTFGPSAELAALTMVAAVATVIVTAGLLASFGRALSLPALSSPFIVVFAAMLGVGPLLGLSFAVTAMEASSSALTLVLEGLGYIVFTPSVLGGALVLAALLVHSRIATSLAVYASLLVLSLTYASRAPLEPSLVRVLTLNATLTAVALGATWFVPSRASYALGLAGAALSMLVTLALWAPMARLGWPVLIAPFNATVMLVLLATRQRAVDGSPKAVDFAAGTPEENLAFHSSSVARFGRAPALHLPFRGAWSCTQGVDGPHTHQGLWRHGYDFEVRGEGGHLYRDHGRTPEDHHCYGLPVLAAADGTVARVVSDVADNAVGGVDLNRNWGNLVLLYHGPGLYSLVAHLAPGSVKVTPGQWVRRGEVLAACGSSGRSPRPHLHFQLQATPDIGAPTLPCRFRDVVLRSQESEEVLLEREIEEGDTVRNVEPDESLARFFAIEIGETLSFKRSGAVETLEHVIDPLGRLVLRSEDHDAALYLGRSDEAMTSFDATGDPRSIVHLLRAALPRVPFDSALGLTFLELAPRRWAVGRAFALARDLIAPFEGGAGIEMRYRVERRAASVVVTGGSLQRDANGRPKVATAATFSRARGLVSVVVEAHGRRDEAVRAEPWDEPGSLDEGRDRAASPRTKRRITRERRAKLGALARESAYSTTQRISEER